MNDFDEIPGLLSGKSSFRKLCSTYSGPLIRIVRVSDNAETNICADEKGHLNYLRVLAFTKNTDAYIACKYEQAPEGGRGQG